MLFIYRIIFPNEKSYIGQTCNLFHRIRYGHKNATSESAIHRAIRKYGWKNIKLDIIDIADDVEQANEKEKYYIKFYNTIGKNGYNMCEGGNGSAGYHHTEESKIKIMLAQTGSKRSVLGKANMKIAQNRPEVKLKRSNKLKGQKRSAEQCRNYKNAALNRTKIKCVHCGKYYDKGNLTQHLNRSKEKTNE